MRIFYVSKWEKIYKKPRKENLVNYSKIAVYKDNKVEYGYIRNYVELITKEYMFDHMQSRLCYYYLCTIIEEALNRQYIIDNIS